MYDFKYKKVFFFTHSFFLRYLLRVLNANMNFFWIMTFFVTILFLSHQNSIKICIQHLQVSKKNGIIILTDFSPLLQHMFYKMQKKIEYKIKEILLFLLLTKEKILPDLTWIHLNLSKTTISGGTSLKTLVGNFFPTVWKTLVGFFFPTD